MPKGVYKRKSKKAKGPRAVNSTRSAAIKLGIARRKRCAARVDAMDGPATKPAPTEQQALPLIEAKTGETPRKVDLNSPLAQLAGSTLYAEVAILRTINDLDSIIQDDHTSDTVKMALKHVSDSFLHTAERLRDSRIAAVT